LRRLESRAGADFNSPPETGPLVAMHPRADLSCSAAASTEQRRHFRIEGDKLFVETAPGPNPVLPGKTSFGRLVFERDK